MTNKLIDTPSPTLTELFQVFGRIGLLSFGGPAAQIALMHRELVEQRNWLSEKTFLQALSLCMLLPGPEAMQLATYAGWRLRGTVGGLVAGLLFVVPGACVILILALVYAQFGQVPIIQFAFSGIKAAVIVIVLQALLKVSSKALNTPLEWSIAVFAFAGLFVFAIPYPLIVLTAALIGAFSHRCSPSGEVNISSSPATDPHKVFAIWGAIWVIPIAFLALLDQPFLLQVALFFSKLAVVTFGGAYAVLAYVTQTVVAEYGWLTTPQMIDALGLAETTPGPLILVTQFVAMLAGFSQGGVLLALVAGAIALWVTFVPCFLWIFLAGPYLDQISARPRLSAALSAITAAVVGVILNLSIWFAIHVLFRETVVNGWISSPLPDLTSLNIKAFVLSLIAGFLLIILKRGIAETLVFMACAGFLLSAI